MPAVVQPQVSPALQKLNSYLDGIGITEAGKRAQRIAAIRTRAEAAQRQAYVRTKILNLIGGLPDQKGPVPVKEFGSLPIRDVGGMYQHIQNEPIGINEEMTLASTDLFRRIITPLSSLLSGFDRLTIKNGCARSGFTFLACTNGFA